MTSIVIVEDETLVRQGLVELLSLDPRFKVIAQAANGDEALRVISEIRPDLVLMDIRLPGLSGPEVVEGMRRKEFTFPSY